MEFKNKYKKSRKKDKKKGRECFRRDIFLQNVDMFKEDIVLL